MTPADERPSSWRAVAAPAAAGLAARLLWIAWTSPLRPSLDEARFWDLATSRMAGTAFLPPLVPGLLVAVRGLFGDRLWAARVVIAALSTVSIVMVFALAERHLGRAAGVRAAWTAALLPTLVYFDGRIRSEPLASLFLLLFAFVWCRPGGEAPRLRFAAGAALGAAALGRPEFAALPAGLWLGGRLLGGRGPGARDAVLLYAGLALVVLPWTIRNRLEIGAFIPISVNGGYNFWKSFNEATDGSQPAALDFSVWRDVPESRMDAFGYAEGWRFIRRHPARSLLLAPLKVGHLLGPERGLWSDMRKAAFPERWRSADLAFALAQNAAWFLLLAGGLVALAGAERSAVKEVVLGVLLLLILVHLVFFGDDRFHVPLLPFLCAILPEALRGRAASIPKSTACLIGVVLLMVLAFWVHVLLRDAGKIAELWGRLWA